VEAGRRRKMDFSFLSRYKISNVSIQLKLKKGPP
jgi:hypothetical protein